MLRSVLQLICIRAGRGSLPRSTCAVLATVCFKSPTGSLAAVLR